MRWVNDSMIGWGTLCFDTIFSIRTEWFISNKIKRSRGVRVLLEREFDILWPKDIVIFCRKKNHSIHLWCMQIGNNIKLFEYEVLKNRKCESLPSVLILLYSFLLRWEKALKRNLVWRFFMRGKVFEEFHISFRQSRWSS